MSQPFGRIQFRAHAACLALLNLRNYKLSALITPNFQHQQTTNYIQQLQHLSNVRIVQSSSFCSYQCNNFQYSYANL